MDQKAYMFKRTYHVLTHYVNSQWPIANSRFWTEQRRGGTRSPDSGIRSEVGGPPTLKLRRGRRRQNRPFLENRGGLLGREAPSAP
jgi:hypothetical protein